MKLQFVVIIISAVFGCQGYAQLPSHWGKLPFTLNRAPHVIYVDENEQAMYVTGEFDNVDSRQTNIFRYKDGQYTLLPMLPMYPTGPITRYKGKLYVGGSAGLARWEEASKSWTILDTGTLTGGAMVTSLYVYQDKLLVGGRFKKIAGRSIATLAVYDGTNWSDYHHIDTFLTENPMISDIIEYKGNLYVTGIIYDADRPDIAEIAMFDGAHWQDVGGGLKGDGLSDGRRMLVWHNELYVAGTFNEFAGSPGEGLVRWNGVHWSAVGGGLHNYGYHGAGTNLIAYHDKLYVAGWFSDIDGIWTQHLARWDGEQWCAVGQFNDVTLGLGVFQDTLYVGGGFKAVDGDTTIRFIAKWKGGDWTQECSGIKYTHPLKEGLLLFPNPTTNSIYMNVANATEVRIYAADGRLTLTADKSEISKGIDVRMLAAGIYFVKVRAGDTSLETTLLKQ